MLSGSTQLSNSSYLCVMSDLSTSSKTCKFFDRGKNCRFGSRCKFLHIPSSSQSENQSCNSKQSTDRVEEVRGGVSALLVETPIDQHEAIPEQRKLCFYFSKYNRCRYGKGCHFEHIRDEVKAEAKASVKAKDVKDDVKVDVKSCIEEKVDEEVGPETPSSSPKQAGQDEEKKKKKRPVRVCRYFKAGHCSMGDRCRFRHPEKLRVKDEENEEEGKEDGAPESTKPQPPRQAYHPRGRQNILVLTEVSSEDLDQCRQVEIAQLKKRYPKSEENIDDKGTTLIQFIFVPSDPDWPFDVKSMPLLLEFKKDYPRTKLDVKPVETNEIPDTVHRVISQSIKSWLGTRYESFKSQGKVEQVVRPFLKWLDRNAEEIFTTGLKQYKREMVAKAAGLTFVTATELQEQYAANSQDSDSASEEEDVEEEGNEGENESGEEEESEDEEGSDEEGSDEEEEPKGPRLVVDPAARGTEVRFQNLQLKNSLATLLATKVSLQIQCGRCRGRTEVATPVARTNAVSCGTCGAASTVAFRAAMVHEHSAVLGYADTDACSLFDVVLPDCEFAAGCLACGKEMALAGVSTGTPKDTWCRSCNAKMRIVTDSIKLLRLQPAAPPKTDEKGVLKVDAKPKRVPKDPAIQDGMPLPNDGICKHYKKSYRWFRFPCCGKAYPCDVCHDEKEDHPYTFANRMICGHCCKEQSYSPERACLRCGESLTKARSSHWEGGKGCRDKIKMARDDAKKYANLNKTVSRKAQGVATGKKNTKLRHT